MATVLNIFFLILIGSLGPLFAAGLSLDHHWKRFKLEHARSYEEGSHEEALRKAIFTENFKSISEHNLRYLRGHETYYQAVNQFTDMTWEEFKAEKTCIAKHFLEEEAFDELEPIADDIDFYFEDDDYKIYNRSGNLKFSYPTDLVPIRDQKKSCGSCWAFASLGVLEYQQKLQKNELVQLSPQELVNCESHSSGCIRGYPLYALRYVQRKGITTEKYLPYKAVDGNCPRKLPPRSNVRVSKVVQTKASENDLADKLQKIGPAAVTIYVDNNFKAYSGGIFSSNTCTEHSNPAPGLHAVVALGFGSDQGPDYWILRNSWGTSWGERGNFRMVKGRNMCSIGGFPAALATLK